MSYSDHKTYKLSFDFDYIDHIKDDAEPVSQFKEGELFYHNSEFARFYAVTDGAQISDEVAAKIGMQMKKKMFVLAEVQLI